MQPQIERILDAVGEQLVPERIDGIINIWSMRPQPGTPLGEAWEQGAQWAWDMARTHLEAGLRAPEVARGWVSVEDAMPPNGLRVMFTWMNSLGKRRTALGRYAAKFSIAEYDDETDGETNDYDAQTETHYAREGWHEMPVEGEQYYVISEKVTHWQMLPETPEQEALRFPARSAAGEDTQPAAEPVGPRYAMVRVEPDVALLASMATCLHHGFGMLSAKEQEQRLTDMRKVFDEAVGQGYYQPRSRSRYIEWLAAANGGQRQFEPMEEAWKHLVAQNPEAAAQVEKSGVDGPGGRR